MIKGKIDIKKLLSGHVMYCVLVLLIIYFSFAAKNFFTMGNFINILLQATYTVIAGMGICLIMISGGIDLSVGYQMSLMSVIMGVLVIDKGWNPVLVMLLILIIGAALSGINGILVVKLKVFPLILTLATQSVFLGVSFLISNSRSFIAFPKVVTFGGSGYLFNALPVSFLVMIAAILVTSFILRRTYFGRYMYGVGGNEEAIKLAGINVERTKVLIYTISGLFVALGTIVMVGRAGAASSSMGVGTEFTCLTAGVLGGISFKGGEGKVSGMVLGILLLQVLSNGMQLLGLGVYPQYIVQGLVLMGAVGFDSFQKGSQAKKKIAMRARNAEEHQKQS